MRRPTIPTGLLVGALVAAPLTAVLFLAWRIAGAPFTPFDLFDWLARVLPGAVVTFGIDAMVTVLRWVAPGSVAELAKPAEQALAVVLFLILGTLAGGSIFAAANRPDTESSQRPAVVTGLVAGFAAVLLGWNAGAGIGASLLGSLWLLGAFVAWGSTIGGAHERLATDPEASSEAARRSFLLRLGGYAAGIAALGSAVGAFGGRTRDGITATADVEEPPTWSSANPLPNEGADVEPVAGTRPELTPLDEHYRIDINTVSPAVDEADWRLTVHGLVASTMEYALEDLRGYPALDQFITLSCISNRIAGDLISTQRWTGVSLQRLLPEWGLGDSASHLLLRSVDGFYEVVALDLVRADERVMLTYAWDGVPLQREHGFPLRIYIPDRYGMKQPKWIESIEVMDHWEAGYWVERGWDEDAIMKATSVIDAVNTDAVVERDGQRFVPIGGIAHAGVRGISRVEVQVDDGAWQEADLREPLSEKTWVLWRYDWPYAAGPHTFAVRCFDGNGEQQVLEPSSVRPDGATGVHRVTRTFA